jgi:hypothetical protein
MKKNEFKELISILAYEKLDTKLSNRETKYFWEKFAKIVIDIKCKPDLAKELVEMVEYDEGEILRLRSIFAGDGIEMTPREVSIFLIGLEIALIEQGVYEE